MLIGSYFNDLKAEEQEYLRTALLLAFRDGQDVPPDRAKQADLGNLRPFHWPLEFPEVFLAEGHAGFDAFVGNPPFIGGKRISTTLGEKYRQILYELYPESSGNADISAFFFLRGYQNLQYNSNLGLLATNTIAQGETQRTGLSKIVTIGGIIYRAVNNHPWPGQAAVVVNLIHIRKGQIKPPFILDDKVEDYISSSLDNRKTTGEPHILVENSNKSFIGSILRGMGFVLEPKEAQALTERDSRNKTVVKPYLNGQDLNSNPTQSASRWVIDFSNLSLPNAQTFSEPFRILKERVYPERMGDEKNRKVYEKIWWQFWRTRPELYSTIISLNRVLIISRVSAHHFLEFSTIDQVFSDRLVVVALCEYKDFALLSSSLHEIWAHRPGTTTHETRNTYFPQDVFETFPFPNFQSPIAQSLETIGETYHEHRHQIMLARQEGLTATYNRFHNPEEAAADIARLRELHVQMDQAVAVAYGWSDLELGHAFHETAQGVRFTLSESARRDVLGRLLALNHRRYEEEVRLGLHNKGGKKGSREGAKTQSKERENKEDKGQLTLF